MKKTQIQGREVEFICLAAAGLLIFMSNAYMDFYATMRHGMTFWTALFDGHPLQFYQYCDQGQAGYSWGGDLGLYKGTSLAAYDFTLYAIFAVWNFPLWLIERFSDINVQEHFWGIIWGKTMILAALLLTARKLKELYRQLAGEHAQGENYLILVYLSSPFLLYYTVSSGNYDILNVLMILCGFSVYLKHERGKFVLFFALSFSMKYFGLIVFIPLLLLREKRVGRIIGDSLCCISISVAEKLLFQGSVQHSAGQLSAGISGTMTAAEVNLGGTGAISLFLMFYIMLAIFCYWWNGQDPAKEQRIAVWVCLVCWILFFQMASVNVYWSVLLVPFMSLVLVIETPRQQKLKYLLEGIGSAALLLHLNIYEYWIVGGQTQWRMLMWQLIARPLIGDKPFSGYTLGNLLIMVNNSYPIDICLTTISTACLVAFAIVSFPRNSSEVSADPDEGKYVRIRLLTNLALGLLPTMLYLAETIAYYFMLKNG